IRKLTSTEFPNLIEENRRLHRALIEGVPVEYRNDEGRTLYPTVKLIDFENPDNNDWLVVDQFTVDEGDHTRRPDVVVFINGLPLAVVEMKNPVAEQATLKTAFNQLQTYKQQIPALFRTNAALVIADGMTARIGSLTANEERFMPWRTTDGTTIQDAGTPETDT